MNCPKCKAFIYKVKMPGTIIWNSKVKKIGYTFYCPKCGFEGKSSNIFELALLFYYMGIPNKYKGMVRATNVDWGYMHDKRS